MRDPDTNVAGDVPELTDKIAGSHLNEFPDYHERLEKLEEEAKKAWKSKRTNYVIMTDKFMIRKL